MAVDLNGFENTPREQRKVLTKDQFEQYVDSLKMPYDEIITTYLAVEVIKKGKIDLHSFYDEYGTTSQEEVMQLIKDELGFDVFEGDSKELLKDIPDEVLAEIGDIDAIIDSVQDFAELSNMHEKVNMEKINELYVQKLKEVATEVSKCDLTQIPPEAYASAQFLKYINFQNTGAKLDFEYINENKISWRNIYISSENLTGTEIISFNRMIYKKNEEEMEQNEFGFYDELIGLRPENFDESYYQMIIDSYKTAGEYIDTNIALFLVNQEIQDNNQWIIDYAFDNLEKRMYIVNEVWKQLSSETQLKNKYNFRKLIDYTLDTSDISFYFMDVLKSTTTTLLEEYAEDVISIYSGDREIEIFFHQVFPRFSEDFKEKFYEENYDLPIEQKSLVLSKTNPEYINQNFIQLLDSYIEDYDREYSLLGPLYHINDIMKYFSKHEFDESVMKHILEVSNNELVESKSRFEYIANKIFSYLTPENQKDYYKEFMQLGVDNNVSLENIVLIFERMNVDVKTENYKDILEFSQTLSPEIAQYIRGTGYINMVHYIDNSKKGEFIEKNIEEILLSFRTKYENKNQPFIDSLLPEDRKKFDANYPKDFIEILLEMDRKGDLDENNINVIIDNLPKLGKEVISRLYSSNSEMIRTNASQLITAVSTLEKDDAIELIEDTERLFSKDTIPDFVKIYKFYENVVEKKHELLKRAQSKGSKLSPELQQASSQKAGMRIIFADLLNISLKSNNKSLRNFINLLEEGNETYVKYLTTGKNLDSLTQEEKDVLRKYADTLYTIYDESLVSKHDIKRTGKKLKNSKDYVQTLDDLSKRYIGNAFPKGLSNEVLKTIVGRMEELLAGRRTIEDFRKYMDEANTKSNERHIELEKTKLVLEPGDLVKGVGDATRFLQSLFSNGIRAGEFLGVSTHTDATPLDSDHSLILPEKIRDTLSDTIGTLAASTYGNFYLVIKRNPEKIYFTRDDPEYVFKEENAPEYQSKLGKNADKQAIKNRINNRINGTFEEPKLEAFSSHVVGKDHYGIRTGMSITDVDYIVVSTYDKRIGYELAMNGTFIPVVDKSTNEVVFGIDDYNKIREQMQGMPYYGTKKFEVDKTAYIPRVEEKVAQLFPDGDVQESISEKDARIKREAIESKVRSAILEKLGLGFAREITGDVAPGFIEFIDTGSTGRGTNLPGDGDFDFSVKIDRDILDNPQRLEQFKQVLREKLAIKSSHKDCKIEELSGNFRYKKVQIEGVDMPLDLDVTFMQKTESVTYSTDMAVKERLQELKQNDPEGYKRVIANIVLAKEMLKSEGIYKKSTSDGATKYGGFGGVGVENWILQNGGSFIKAMQSFLEASEKANTFDEFMEIYPIFDFGQNHMGKGYSHDSFIKGLTSSGYSQMKSKFKEFIKQLENEQSQEISIVDLSKNAIRQAARIGEFAEAAQSMKEESLEIDSGIDFEGGN